MHNVTIICMGKLAKGFLQEGCQEYIKRLQPLCNVNVIQLNDQVLPEKNLNPTLIERALEKEAEEIIKNIPKQSFVIPLCIEGKQYASEELADIFHTKGIEGFSNFTFIIGSSHGLSSKVKNLAHLKMSMSKMTFPHQLARLMLLEQIYRGFSILKGTKYHK